MDKSEIRMRLMQVVEQYAKSPSWTPRQEVRQPLFWKTIRAEFIGSFLLMIFSTSSDVYIGPVSYGCMVTILTYALRATTVHLNPCITVAAAFLRSITPFRCVALILAQSLGTLSGATVIALGLADNSTLVSPILDVSQPKGFGYEFFATFVIILTLASHFETPADEAMFSLTSGLTTGVSSSFSRSATGGFLNPFRAFSLALFQNGCWSSHYVYWTGPILGTLLAVFTYDFIRLPRPTATSTPSMHMNGVPGSHIRHEEDTTQMDTEFTLATLT